MTMRWTEETKLAPAMLGAPGQLGMTAAEWQWWNKSVTWFMSVIDANYSPAYLTAGQVFAPGAYYTERFPAGDTALRWVAFQRAKTLYEEWSKKTSKPIKVCMWEMFETESPGNQHGFIDHNFCYDGVALTQVTKTNTQINTTCPPGYTKIVHDDGSFGCIAPYVANLTCVENCQQKYATEPQNFAWCLAKCASTPPPPPIPPTPAQFTPRGYRQPVTTVVQPPAPIFRPPQYRIAGAPDTLGELPVADIAMAKAILAAWNGTDGNNSIGGYGLQPADISPVWGDRDGWTLANFYNWWNKSGWAPPLPNPTTKNELAWQDLTTQSLYSLKVWAQAKGITIVPGQLPNPGFPSAPIPIPTLPVPSAPPPQAPQAPLPRVPTPVPGNPSDVTNCDPGFHWDPVSKLCVVTPLPIPPNPINPPTSSEGGGNTGILIAVGALALLGLGAAIFGGGSGGGGGAAKSRDNPVRDNPSGPAPMSGYAYVAKLSGSNWRTVSDEAWDTEMITPELFKWRYVGQRQIDGVRTNVWKRGTAKTTSGRHEYIAQTARGGDPRDYN